MNYYHFTRKMKTISGWWYLIAGLIVLLSLFAFNSWQLHSEEQARLKGSVYSETDYQKILREVAYDEETNRGKNNFVVTQAYYLSRLKGYQSYQSQADYRDYYKNELMQLENYEAGAYFMGMGATANFGNGVYPGAYLKGKQVLNQALSDKQLAPQSLRYGTSNWMFPVTVLNHLSSFYGLFLIVLVVGLPFLLKYEKNQIKLIFTQPVSRGKVVLTDSLFVFGRLILVVGGLLFFSFVCGKVMGQDIPADYPLLINSGNYRTMPLYQYLFSTSFLLILSLFFVFLLCQIIVLFTRNSLIALVLSLLLVGYGQVLLNSHNETIKSVAPYLAPLYLTPQKIYTGLDYQPQEEIVMDDRDSVPGDYIKGQEDVFSLATRVDLSEGSFSPSRRKFFVASFYPENSRYYAGESFQGRVGQELNFSNGVWVLVLSCLAVGAVGVVLVHKKSF